ncbi:hypothetical protein PV336_34785 [Streptomyces sp. MI02-2A]|uniref:hypothetical protein n=1 Tax=Streptomyces sp. MI02-2A TaxID=3028688 RepID=UPI0029BA7A1C|nr:hypothetical protein [Streptomyces sp. MI02-2A]MDX3264313.1 hypothetical protein [Streptomyces sp. MI02-2A]
MNNMQASGPLACEIKAQTPQVDCPRALSLIAPPEVATEIDNFARAINSFLNGVARSRDTARDPMSPEEFEHARQAPAGAQVKLVNAARRSRGTIKKD